MSQVSRIKRYNISDLNELMFDSEGRLQPVCASVLREIEHDKLRFFCNAHGLYSIPSTQLLDELRLLIGDPKDCLEIGGGNGVYGRELGITSTDNYMQHPKNSRRFNGVQDLLKAMGIVRVQYGDNVQEYDAIDAVRKFKPSTVFGAWVTHKYNAREHWRGGNMYGINFDWILKRKGVERFILVGNDTIHNKMPIMEKAHKVIDLDNIIFSRASNNKCNRIYVWEVSKL